MSSVKKYVEELEDAPTIDLIDFLVDPHIKIVKSIMENQSLSTKERKEMESEINFVKAVRKVLRSRIGTVNDYYSK